ncbi:MAG TPA: hypothetical protein VM933_11640, partial [Acidimicrobiales bacterium]|nr:hypothetical protein [Acidimicrobiales bacterium]
MDQPPATPSATDLASALRDGLQTAADLGLVGITEAGLDDWAIWDALVAIASRDELPVDVRVLVASGAADLDRMAEARAGESSDRLAVVGVKFYADGWLGPRTCACSLPFADVEPGPDDRGILFLDAATLARRAAPYADAGWGLAT